MAYLACKLFWISCDTTIDLANLSNVGIWEYIIFNGAAFVEKMLRTVPDVGKIFLLIKANDKEAAIDRLKNEVC